MGSKPGFSHTHKKNKQKNGNLPSFDSKIACASASKLPKPNVYISRAGCESQPGLVSSGLNAHLKNGLSSSSFSLILNWTIA